MGNMPESDLLHLAGGGHFEVQRYREGFHQSINVCVSNVAAIFSEMGGDPVPRVHF